jgi:hypothetical protein
MSSPRQDYGLHRQAGGVTKSIRRLVLLIALGFAFALAVVSAGFAGYYFSNPSGQCMQPGQAAVSGQNSWSLNVMDVGGYCASNNKIVFAGLTYMRGDGSLYPYIWFNWFTGPSGHVTLVDSQRSISYGRAICKANSGNDVAFRLWYCYAS